VPHDPLRALDALERRFDGPIPSHLRAVARLGSDRAVRRREAEARAAAFTALVRGQLRAIRLRRAAGGGAEGLLPDLGLYRRERRRFRRIARLFAQNEAVSPPSTTSTCPLT
jgi:hypothetical protein